MAKQNTMDLTQGRSIKRILLFSLPLVMGTLFQQLYSFVDTIMVGRLISEDALAAVGTTDSLNFLTLVTYLLARLLLYCTVLVSLFLLRRMNPL